MDTENSNDVTGLLITPGLGLSTKVMNNKVTLALAGLDNQSAERRLLAQVFGPASVTTPTLIQPKLHPVDPRPIDPRSKRIQISGRKKARHGRRRMRAGVVQYRRKWFAPSRVVAFWVSCWLGSILLAGCIGFFLGVYLVK